MIQGITDAQMILYIEDTKTGKEYEKETLEQLTTKELLDLFENCVEEVEKMT